MSSLISSIIWGICVLTPVLNYNYVLALVFVILPSTIHKSIVNGHNRGKYAKMRSKITCESLRVKSQSYKNENKNTTQSRSKIFHYKKVGVKSQKIL
jgi:uncharacterized membrane protein